MRAALLVLVALLCACGRAAPPPELTPQPTASVAAAPSPAPSPPRWASFFTGTEYALFMAYVRVYLAAEGHRVEYDEEGGTVTLPGGSVLGLRELAEMCRGSDPSEWQALVNGYFAHLLAQLEEAEPDSFEEVQDRLTLRLYPPGPPEALEGERGLVHRSDLEGLWTLVVVDAGKESPDLVYADLAKRWGKTPEELLQLGLESLRKRSLPALEPLELTPEGDRGLTAGDESYYTSTLVALRLEELPGCLGPGGALLALPTRHTAVCYPIQEAAGARRVLKALPAVAATLEREGPGSLSAGVFWYHEGAFTPITPEAPGEAWEAALQTLP